MNIGIFDSGLGGLVMMEAIVEKLPTYNYILFADTKHVPYGEKTPEQIYRYTAEALQYLFSKENCALVILACNSASANALPRIQKEWLPKHFPDRKVLGVIVPTIEECDPFSRVGLLATHATVRSRAFPREFKKHGWRGTLIAKSAPKLVPFIEAGKIKEAEDEIQKNITVLLQKKVTAVILGCTHYPLVKKAAKKILGGKKLVSQDEFIPKKIRDYLSAHTSLDRALNVGGKRTFICTKKTAVLEEAVTRSFGKQAKLMQKR